jgi:hypothetical protein
VPSGSDAITLSAGKNLTGLKFGQTQLSSIGGSVYLDANLNGKRDANETGLAGWTLTLVSASNSSKKWTTTTDASGDYSFPVPAGSYVLTLTQKAGYAATNPSNDRQSSTTTAAEVFVGRNFGQRVTSPVTISAVRTVDPLNAAEDIVTFYALNDGIGVWAGTSKILAEDATLTSAAGLVIRTDDAEGTGVADDADFAGENTTPTASFIRIGGPAFFVASTTPAADTGKFTDNESLKSFEVAGTILGGVVADTGAGVRIAQALVPHNATVTLAGSLAAEAGPVVTFSDTST